MSDERHIISHKDGRQYSVTRDAFAKLYEPQGFRIDHTETTSDFDVVGIPTPKAPRKSPRPKASRPAKPKPAAPLATVPAEAPAEG